MDSASSTASLLLFPIYTDPGTPGTSPESEVSNYHQFQLAASSTHQPVYSFNNSSGTNVSSPSRTVSATAISRLPRPVSPSSPSPLPFRGRSATFPEAEKVETDQERDERRRLRREERKRQELTAWRSEDGLLSPPPVGGSLRRRSSSPTLKNLVISGRLASLGRSTPDLHLHNRTQRQNPKNPNGLSGSRSAPVTPSDPAKQSFVPKRPHEYNRAFESPNTIVSPRRTSFMSDEESPIAKRRATIDLQRPKPIKSRTADSILLRDPCIQLIKPPLPSLLRPKSFWKNHPRSALTAPSYSPSSSVVRRSTFIAAGMSLEADSPRTPSSSELGESHLSLLNASTLALAVETRREEGVICVPGDGFY